MACVFTYKGVEYPEAKFKALLKGMTPTEAAPYMPGVKAMPSAPWKKDWQELALRRVLKMAVDEGYDSVAWTSGAQQNERYDLSKVVDQIIYVEEDGKYWFSAHKNGREVIPDAGYTKDKLVDVVGKDVADRMIKGEGKPIAGGNEKELVGDDLRIGGTGMVGFYDKILPSYANAFGKKFGAKVRPASMPLKPETATDQATIAALGVSDAEWRSLTSAQRAQAAGEMAEPVHAIDITPEMRAALKDRGVAKFATGRRSRAAAGGEAASPADQAKLAAVEAEFQRLANQMFPGLKVKMVPKPMQIPGRARELIASYQMSRALGGIASISMASTDGRKRSPEEMATLLGHEGIHHLVETGIIPKREWTVLEGAAKKFGWRDAYKIDERYPAETSSERDEEAVAHAYGYFLVNETDVPPGVRTIFQRLKLFFERLGQWLRRNGFEARFEQIFKKIKAGEYNAQTSPEAARVLRTVAIKDARIAAMLDAQQAADKRPPGLKLAQATGNLDRQIKGAAGMPLNDIENGERGPDRLLPDIGMFRATVFDPRAIATDFKGFVPYYLARAQRYELRDTLVWKYQEISKPYLDLSRAEQKNVDKVMEMGALQYEVWGGTSIRATNDGRPDQGGKAALTQPGEVVTLTAKESAAYNSMRRMYDTALDDLVSVLLHENGIDTSNPAAPRTSKQLIKAALKAARDGDKERAGDLRYVAKIVEEVEDAKRWGYFPFSRYGRVAIVVQERKKEVGIGHDGGQSYDWETIERPHFEVGDSKSGSKPFLEMPEIKAEYDRLVAKYGNNPNYRVEKPFLMQPESMGADVSASEVDETLEAAGINADTRETVMERVRRLQQSRSFKRHFFRRRNIPGYSTDFSRVHANYILSISNYLARRRTQGALDRAMSDISPHQPALKKYAERLEAYDQDQQEEWQRLRQWTVLMTMGFNISTALVNATQVPVMTGPHLSTYAPNHAAAKEISRAYVQTAQMLRKPSATRTYADDVREGKPFDLSKAPADVRAELQQMEREGAFMPTVTLDMMGQAKNVSPSARGAAKVWDRIVEWSMALFATVETENRLVTAIAAIRIAKRPGTAERALRITKNDPLAQAELFGTPLWNATEKLPPTGSGSQMLGILSEAEGVTRQMIAGLSPWLAGRASVTREEVANHIAVMEWSPFRFAEWSVKETQFILGKKNRPAIGRGAGQVVLSLRSFSLQALERFWKLARLYGTPGRIQALKIAIALIIFAGINGLPGMENITEIVDWVVSKIRGQDFDFRRQMREALAEMTTSTKAAEAISNGMTRYMGIDTERRVGMGSVPGLEMITGALGGRQTPMETIGNISVPARLALDMANGALDGVATGDGRKLTHAFMPTSMKNLLTSQEWADAYEGNVRSGVTGLTAIPKSMLGSWDYIVKSIGFNPASVANIREAEWAAARESRAVQAQQGRYVREIARNQVAAERATAAGDAKAAKRFTDQAAALFKEVEAENVGRPESRKIVIDQSGSASSALNRAKSQERLGNAVRSKAAPVKTRGERARIEDIYGVGRN